MVTELSGEHVLTGAPPPAADAAALVRHGIELQALGRWAEASEPLLRATVLAPTNPDAWLQASMNLGIAAREDQAEQAAAALRQLRPARGSMWFAGEVEEPLLPFAQLSQAVYVLLVEKDEETGQGILTRLVDGGHEAAPPGAQQVVAAALTMLGREKEVVERYQGETDPALRMWVASALLTQGARLADKDQLPQALASWRRVVDAYGDDPGAQHAVAGALINQAAAYGLLGQASDQLKALGEAVHRYARTPDPALRRRAAAALASQRDIFRDSGQQHAAQEAADRLLTLFQGDPDPVIAGLAAGARIDRWLAGHRALPRFLASPLRGLLRLAARLRYRRRRSTDYPWKLPSRPLAVLGSTLIVTGRVVQVAAIVGAVVFTIRAGHERQTTSGLVLACGALAMLAHFAAVTGQRLRGRFTADMLRLVPSQLPRTVATAVFALAVAWVAPTLEHFGLAYTFSPPRETYRWFHGIGLPSWADISVMVVLAPIEIILLSLLFTGVVLMPLRALLGKDNALVAALEDTFPSFKVESGEEM
jgi:tetratricopeptide (TPR) repeat protein